MLVAFLIFFGFFSIIQNLIGDGFNKFNDVQSKVVQQIENTAESMQDTMDNITSDSIDSVSTITELEEKYNSDLQKIEAAHQENMQKLEQEYQIEFEEIESEYQRDLAMWGENSAASSRDNSKRFTTSQYDVAKKIALNSYEMEKKSLDSKFNREKSTISEQQKMKDAKNGVTDISNGIFDIFKSDSNDSIVSKPFKIFSNVMFVILGLILISVIVSIIVTIIQAKNLKYVITDKRAIIQKGAIGLDYRAIDYTKIDDILVNVGVIDKMFNTGTIVLVNELAYSSGTNNNQVHSYKKMDESNSFIAVERPYDVFNKLKKVSQDIRTDMYYPNDLRPDGNKGYGTKYNDKEN